MHYFDLGQLKLRSRTAGSTMAPGGFYWEAIKAWSMLTVRAQGGLGRLGHDHIFYNHMITDEAGLPLTPKPWMTRKGILRVGTAQSLSGLGLTREQWFELVYLRQRIPPVPLSDRPHYILSGPAGDKDVRLASFKELYLSFRAKVDNPRHFEEKWEQALGVTVTWTDIWKRVHESNCSFKVRSQVWRQLNLNFWTAYMDYAYIARGDGTCSLCGQWARRRWHVVTECAIVKELWRKLGVEIETLGGERTVEVVEMALGREGRDRGTVLRNRLGFTLRSAVMSLRAVRAGGFGETVDRIWSHFLHSLKKELVEEWYTARLEGSVALFESRVLVAGLLGRLEGGTIIWCGLAEGVGYRYWDLFD